MTFQQEALPRIFIEVLFGFLQFRAFRRLNPGAVQLKEDGLKQSANRVSIVDHAIGVAQAQAWRVCVGGAKIGVGWIKTASAALLPKYSRARIRALRFLRAAGDGDQGADEHKGDFLRKEVHVKVKGKRRFDLIEQWFWVGKLFILVIPTNVRQSNSPTCFLFDNGSLRPASTLRLRQTASVLSETLRTAVRPVSLLHSSAIDPQQLGDIPAELLEPALQSFFRNTSPAGDVILLPFFFGPSAALSDYVPERIEALRKNFPQARLCLAKPLVEVSEGDERIASALAEATRQTIALEHLVHPRVVLVDHGSPRREVTDVRNHLGAQLRRLLGLDVDRVGVASMERRPEPEFAFNEPLLAECLRTPPFDRGEVVVTLQFLAPGRHAGGAGDIAEICAQAEKERPGLRTYRAEPIGQDPRVVAVLADRYREACQSNFLGSIKPTSSA